MIKKTDLRLKAKALRKSLNIPEISKCLAEKIRAREDYKFAKHVMLFYPTKFEVDFKALFADNKKFYLPRVHGDILEVCPYKSGDFLQKSEFGIMEPISKPVSKNILDLVIVPALMCDLKGYRLGYGGGYYDRFLKSKSEKTKSICLISKELIIKSLPVQDFDIPVDIVITND